MLIPFSTIIGQDKAKQLLLQAVAAGRIGHAYLFRGPAGVGKKTCALAFAALLNCHQPKGAEICRVCPSCIKYASGNHPDLVELLPQSGSIKIDQVRELKKALAYPPFEAHFRVVLIPDIHLAMRRREVTNSLLKTLEEPPADTIFILTGDEAGDILPTILSRCQIITFFPLPYAEVAHALTTDGLDPAAAGALSAITEGSLGRARLLAGEELLPLRRHIVEELISLVPDRPETVEAVFQMAERAADAKENLDELLDLLVIWIRDIMLCRQGLADRAISVDLRDLLPQAAARWPQEELEKQLHLITRARRQLTRNCNRTLVCEVLFFGLV